MATINLVTRYSFSLPLSHTFTPFRLVINIDREKKRKKRHTKHRNCVLYNVHCSTAIFAELVVALSRQEKRQISHTTVENLVPFGRYIWNFVFQQIRVSTLWNNNYNDPLTCLLAFSFTIFSFKPLFFFHFYLQAVALEIIRLDYVRH